MNNNRETERAEPHKTIRSIASDLRSSVDGWDFKSYVLGKNEVNKVYDPAWGPGSLLLKFAKVLAHKSKADLEGENG